MGKTERQKRLLAAYKERKVVGGVCRVTCTATGTCLLLAAPELRSQRSRFVQAVSTGMPLVPAMARDWRAWGAEAFRFEVLEELEQKEDRTDREFRDDLKALAGLWREKLAGEGAAFYV